VLKNASQSTLGVVKVTEETFAAFFDSLRAKQIQDFKVLRD